MGLQAIDEGASFALERLHRPGLNEFMASLTHLGDESFLFGITSLGALLLVWLRGWRTAVILVTVALAGSWLTSGTKSLIPRKRPDLPNPIVQFENRAEEEFRSFPSGHALNAATIYMSIAVLATRFTASRLLRWVIILGALGLILLIGFTRIYLCVHWLSDVLAGLSAGLGLAVFALWADTKWSSLPSSFSSPDRHFGRLSSLGMELISHLPGNGTDLRPE